MDQGVSFASFVNFQMYQNVCIQFVKESCSVKSCMVLCKNLYLPTILDIFKMVVKYILILIRTEEI